MTLYKGGVAWWRGVHHGHGVGRDPVTVGRHRGRVNQDGARRRGQAAETTGTFSFNTDKYGENVRIFTKEYLPIASREAGVQREVPGASGLTGLKHRGLRLGLAGSLG